MCHEYDQEFMLVDKTWGIMPPSGRCLLAISWLSNFLYNVLTVSYCNWRLFGSFPRTMEFPGMDFQNSVVRENLG